MRPSGEYGKSVDGCWRSPIVQCEGSGVGVEVGGGMGAVSFACGVADTLAEAAVCNGTGASVAGSAHAVRQQSSHTIIVEAARRTIKKTYLSYVLA